jgi:chaperone modulatory protein CbpM
MNATQVEWGWLETTGTVTLNDLAGMCGLATAELDELVEYGALQPMAAPASALFSAACVAPLRTAGRLRRDYDLDLFSVGLLLEYLSRIDTLEQQVQWLQAQNPLAGGLRPVR